MANAQVTDSGGVTDGAITQDSYKVKVNGDGTTTINIYYTRNLYTLEFVLARQNNGNNNFRWPRIPRAPLTAPGWKDTGNNSFGFRDFNDGVTVTEASGGETYGGLTVQKTYRLTEAIEPGLPFPCGTIRYQADRYSGDNLSYLSTP